MYLSQADFERSFELAPRAAVCLLVRDARGAVLLTKRAEGMTMAGVWHLPGAFLLRNETLLECTRRAVRKELGTGIVGDPKPFGFFEDLDADPRGHVIDLVVELELDGEPRETEETGGVRFFATVPEGVAFYHDRVLRAAGLS